MLAHEEWNAVQFSSKCLNFFYIVFSITFIVMFKIFLIFIFSKWFGLKIGIQ